MTRMPGGAIIGFTDRKLKLVTLTAAVLLTAGAGWAQTTTTTTTTTVHLWDDPHAWWGNHWVYRSETKTCYIDRSRVVDRRGRVGADHHHYDDHYRAFVG